MDKSKISFTLNGAPVSVKVPPLTRLTDVLRDELGMIGTKVGCDAGDCGACSVLMDGETVCACMVPAGRLEGRHIVSVEGLGEAEALSLLQKSFLHYGAAQCGICTPAMLVSASALLAKNPRPTTEEVQNGLGGVLCRCTGYQKIIQAVMTASDFSEAPVEADQGDAVGSRLQRVDGVQKVLGTDIFGGDEAPEGALVVKAVRSPFHRAGFVFGDLAAYVDTHPGVRVVLTADDVPGVNCFGVIAPMADQPVFAETQTRFKGEAVAAVVGDAQTMKAFDVDLFPITWTELVPLLTPQDALKSDAPQLHADRPNNTLMRGVVQRGDLDGQFAAADVTVEGNFQTGFVEHAYIEPEAGFARRVGDRIEVQACTQAPYMDRDDVAKILGLDVEDVRIIPTSVGGGFGSKLDLSVQPFIALAAWILNEPVRMTYTRPESMMSTTKRHPSKVWAKISATKDGKLAAMDFDGVFNTGAYASWGPTVGNRVPVHAAGPYIYPAYRAKSHSVHTHCAPAGAFRGFGVPQSSIAQETLFDELANKLGIDRLEFRLKNALVNGAPTVTGQVFESGIGFKECLEALKPRWRAALDAADAFNSSTAAGERWRGVGIAGMWYGCGNTSLSNPSTMRVAITPDGRCVLFQGAVDIGQGSNTVMTQICADALGLKTSHFELIGGDTDVTADAGKTSASRQTFVSGKASYLAGRNLREKILHLVNASDGAQIELSGDVLNILDQGTSQRIELASLDTCDDGFVLSGEGTFDPQTTALDENGQGDPYAAFGYGAHIMELEVDTKIGAIKLIRLTAAHDVGRAINPMLIEGQVEGGVAQGIGLALMEEFIPGRSENLHDYLIPTTGDMPQVDTILVEAADPNGPYGAKGIGEQVLIPTAPAILNAIYHATGARVTQLPATFGRVLDAINDSKRNQ
ncbi:MAG: molybdopterin-dependent oxidoreductase [Magnetovibrio sp.]|nr:molybdopterin-dependent oxidoreductase [Magnetovibrio sp.]